MTLKTKMSLLLFLTSISIVSIGFSSWSITAESVAEAKGNIEVDSVEGNKLSDFGFSTLNIDKFIKYIKQQDSVNGTKYTVTDFSVTVSTSLDMSNSLLQNLNYDNEMYDYVYVKIDIINYSNLGVNKIKSLEVSLTYEPSISFEFLPVDNNLFKIKLKSKEQLSLYTIAMFDDYAKYKDNTIAMDFKFNFDFSTINYIIFESDYKYNVSFYLGG